MLEALGLLFVVLVSATLAMGAARAVLSIVLYMMRVTAVGPEPELMVPHTTAQAARGLRVASTL